MQANFYKIEALTNMHVGSGDANYGVIDNLVQRDVVTQLPTINGSGVKGALKEFFEEELNWKEGVENRMKLKAIFGDSDQAAAYRFLSANLLVIPVRANKKAYYLATTPSILIALQEDFDNFLPDYDSTELKELIKIKPEKGEVVLFHEAEDLKIEDFESYRHIIKPFETNNLFGNIEDLVLLNEKDFNMICSDLNLPVIARNKIGEDKNLWYEQVVPRKSLFWFTVLHDGEYFDDFNLVCDTKSIVHIGANATVGYGFTKISKLA